MTQPIPAPAGSMAGPLQPTPAPPPAPPAAPAPHPDESFVPGQMGWYSYHDHRDPEGVQRTQAVLVTHTDATHVHGMVIGDARTLASFANGVMTHDHPAAAAG